MELSTLSDLFGNGGSAFPFRVQAVTPHATHGLKLTIVGKRANGKFDSKASAKAKPDSTRAGWRPDLRIWKAI